MLRNTLRQKKLLEQTEKIFRTSDLAVLWGIINKNTLWRTINRYVKRNILYSIFRGLYSTVPIEKLGDFELGCAMCGPYSYISAEKVLELEGIIMQKVNKITLFGSKRKEFEINGKTYLCRYLNPDFLLNREGITYKDGFYMATKERALADLQYIDPNYYVDNTSGVNYESLNVLKMKVGYI